MIANRVFAGDTASAATGSKPLPPGENPWEPRVQELTRAVGAYIVRNPAMSLGIALAVGVCIGWLVKRR